MTVTTRRDRAARSSNLAKGAPSLRLALEPRIVFDAALGASFAEAVELPVLDLPASTDLAAGADPLAVAELRLEAGLIDARGLTAAQLAAEAERVALWSARLSPDATLTVMNADSAEGPALAGLLADLTGVPVRLAEPEPAILVVIDGRVADPAGLLAALGPRDVVLRLDAGDADPLGAIGAALAELGSVAGVQVLSHGGPGSVTLGALTLDVAALADPDVAASLAAWRPHLGEGADLVLWGCDAGSGAAGAAFVMRLAALTGADVAASDDPTGDASLGGDWVAERRTGTIDTGFAPGPAWAHLLAPPTLTPPPGVTDLTVSEPTALLPAGTTVAALSGYTVADPENGTVTVTVTVADLLVGTLSATVGGGTAVAGGFSFTGTGAAATTWLNGLRFTAADRELGATAATTTLTIQVTDAEAPPLSTSRTVNVTVVPANDPTVLTAATQAATEGGTTIVSALTRSGMTPTVIDPEVGTGAGGAQVPGQIVYRLATAPTRGFLTLAGARIGVGSGFTQADVEAGLLAYVHTQGGEDQNAPDSFQVLANDGATPQASSALGTVTVTIAPVNGPPAGGPFEVAVFEGQPATARNLMPGNGGALYAPLGAALVFENGGDPSSDTLTLRIDSLPAIGTLSFWTDANANGLVEAAELAAVTVGQQIAYADQARLLYAHDGSEPNDAGEPDTTFNLTVRDAGGGTGVPAERATSVQIDVLPVSDDPVFDPASIRAATVTANGPDGAGATADDFRVTLTPAMLNATDIDGGPDTLSFAVIEAPVDGVILKDGFELPTGSSFTLADLAAGRIQYLQLAANVGGANPTDQFRVILTDGSTSLRWGPNGEDFTRPTAAYDSGAEGAALSRFLFTVTLAATPDTRVSPGPAPGGDNDRPAPTLPTPAPILFLGDNPATPGTDTAFNEGGQGTILTSLLQYVAGTAPAAEIVYTITTPPANGTLLRDFGGGDLRPLGAFGTFTQADIDAGRVRFAHDGNEIFQSQFAYTVSAGGVDPDGTPRITAGVFDIYATPVNDAPTATGSTNVLAEGGTFVLGTGQLSASDPDDFSSEAYLEAPDPAGTYATNFARNHGYAGAGPDTPLPALRLRIDSLPVNGALEQDFDGDGTFAAATVGQIFDAAQVALGRLRYVHNGLEGRTDSVQATAIDWTGATNQTTVSFVVTNTNDPPEIARLPSDADPPAGGPGRAPNVVGPAANPDVAAINDPLTVAEGGTGAITPALLQAYDSDSTRLQVQFRVTQAPLYGRVTRDGATIGVGSAFTQQDLLDGRIAYVHDGSDTYQTVQTPTVPGDRFVFTLADGIGEQTSNEFWIFITPTNDAPTITGGPSGTILVDATTPTAIAGVTVEDIDLSTGGVVTGETDVLRAVVRLRDAGGTLLADYSGLTIGIAAGSGVTIDGTFGGTNAPLVLQGTRAQVQAALAGLSLLVADDRDLFYTLEVVADDRVRDGAGALAATATANGGDVNAPATPGGPVRDIPETDPSPLSGDFAAAEFVGNVAIRQYALYVSRTNDAPTVTYDGGAVAVTEDTNRTVVSATVGQRVTIDDEEARETGGTVSVTLTVGQGTLFTVGTPANVTRTGNNSGTLTLTGTVAAVQAALDAGIQFRTALNQNGDPGQIDVTISDLGAVGTGGAQTATTSIDLLDAVDVNDRPTLSIGTGQIIVADTTPVAITLPALDTILADFDDAAETSVVKVIVRLLDQSGAPLPLASYTGITLGFTATGATVAADGVEQAIILQGTINELETALSGLTIAFTQAALGNDDQIYQLQVIVDDRTRDPDTTLTAPASANGGALNQTNEGNPALSPSAVPDTEFDLYAGTNAELDAIYNIARAQRQVFVSGVNDPVSISVTPPTVTEGSATYTLSALTNALSDPDDNGGILTGVLALDRGTIVGVTAGGATFGPTGGSSITFSGTEAQLNAALGTIVVRVPGNTADWHGTIGVTLAVNDQGNTGQRPATIPGDTNDPTQNPGDYAFADGVSAALVTTRSFALTVTNVNDRPTIANSPVLSAATVPEDMSAPTGQTLASLIGLNGANIGYSDATDDQTGNSGGNAATDLSLIALVGNFSTPAQGVWQYSTDGGATYFNVPTTLVNSTATLILPQTALVRFVPSANFFGTPGNLQARAADSSVVITPSVAGTTPDLKSLAANGGTGATGAWSVNNFFIATSVTNVNDRPVGQNVTLASVPEDAANPAGTTVATLFAGANFSDAMDDQRAITGGGNAAAPAIQGLAVTGNAATAAQGRWEYTTDGGTSWLLVPTSADGDATDDLSDANALLLPTTASLRFLPAANYNGTPPALSVRVSDVVVAAASRSALDGLGQTSAYGATTTIGVTVTPRNDAPTLGAGAAAGASVAESGVTGVGTAPVAIVTGAQVADLDLATTVALAGEPTRFGSGTLTVSLAGGVTGDRLFLAGGTGQAGLASVTGGADGADLVITLVNTATLAQIDALLADLRFQHLTDTPPAGARTLTVTLSDGNNDRGGGIDAGGPAPLSATLTGSVTVTPANDPPLAIDDAGTLTEDTPSVSGNLKSDGTDDSDPDDALGVLTIPLVRREGGTEVAAVGGTITVVGLYGTLVVEVATGAYTYTLDPTNAAVQALNPGETLPERFVYTLSDPGGRTDEGLLTLTITGANDAPTVGATPVAAGVEDTDRTLAVGDFNFADADGGAALAAVTVSPPTAGTLLLNGVAVTVPTLVTAAQLAAGALVYRPVPDAQGTGVATLAFTVSDGSASSAAATLRLDLAARNDQPTVAGPAGVTRPEDATVRFDGVDVARITVGDPDDLAPPAGPAATDLLTVTLTVLGGTLTAGGAGVTVTGAGTATLTLAGTTAAVNAALATLTYTPSANATGPDTLTVVVDDGLNGGPLGEPRTATLTVPLARTPLNDAPVAAPPGALTVDEDSAPTPLGLAPPTDVDFDLLTITIDELPTGGRILRADGTPLVPGDRLTPADLPGLVFVPDPGFSGPAGRFAYTVTDPVGGRDSSFVTLTVRPVNDPPTATLPALITVTEDATTPISGIVLGDALDLGRGTAADVVPLTVTLSVRDGTLAVPGLPPGRTLTLTGTLQQLQAALAGLTYTPLPGNPVDDLLTVTLNDAGNGGTAIGGVGGPLSATATAPIRVAPANDPPTVTLPAAIEVREETPLALGPLLAIDDPTDLGLGSGADAVPVTLRLAVTAGTLAVPGGAPAATLTLTGTFAQLRAQLAGLTYTPAAGNPGDAALTVTLDDAGNGGTAIGGTGGPLQAVATATLTVRPVNDPPTATIGDRPLGTIVSGRATALGDLLSVGDPVDFAENPASRTVPMTATVTVLNGTWANGQRSVTVTGTRDQINAQLATLVYTPDRGFGGTDTLTLTVTDGGNGGTAIGGLGGPLTATATRGLSVTRDSEFVPLDLPPPPPPPDFNSDFAPAAGQGGGGGGAPIIVPAFDLRQPAGVLQIGFGQAQRTNTLDWLLGTDPFQYDLFLVGAAGNRVILVEERVTFQVSKAIFRHSDPGETLTYEAKRPDGSPLPAWLSFEADTLTFSGTPPAEAAGQQLDIVIVARDTRYQEVAAPFQIVILRDLRDVAQAVEAGAVPEGAAAEALGELPPADAPSAPGAPGARDGGPDLMARLRDLGPAGTVLRARAMMAALEVAPPPEPATPPARAA